jgi:deoxyribonuclease V
VGAWPDSAEELVGEQKRLAAASQPPWRPANASQLAIAGCFVCFPRGETGPGDAGDSGWAAAAVLVHGQLNGTSVVTGAAGAPYEPGLLALREGPLLEAAVRELDVEPDVLLVDATGRDHPRRAGLALHLGWMLGLATVGVTHRLLVADGPWPSEKRGDTSPFHVDGELAGYWLRTRRGARPLAIHAGWRTEPEQAVEAVLANVHRSRTPESLRQARRLARTARARG